MSKFEFLEKAAKQAGVSVETAKDMILMEHQLNQLYPKSKVKTMTLNFSKKDERYINKIAKRLKISVSAVVTYSLFNSMEKEELKV